MNEAVMYGLLEMHLANSMLHKGSQSAGPQSTIYKMTRIDKSVDIESRLVVARAWGLKNGSVISWGWG